MKRSLLKVGQYVVNVDAITSAHWEGTTLYVHLLGGRFESFKGAHGQSLWEALQQQALDVQTGEVGQ